MATPKLKVYLLGSDYSPSADNDIQGLSKDEIYPVVEKNLSALQSHRLVGVERRDSQLVFPRELGGSPITHTVEVSVSENGSTFLSPYVDCMDWLLEVNSIKIYVRKTLDGQSPLSTDWAEISSDYWKYYVREVKRLYDSNFIETATSDDVAYVFNGRDIRFEIGRLLFSDNEFWTDGNVAGYSYYEPINSIKIEYTRYHELDKVNADASGYLDNYSALPFGEIYNGNKSGRIGAFVEGNYGYRRSIYPLRQRVATTGGPSVPHDEFLVDYQIDAGKIVCEGCGNWILLGDAKPKLFRRFWTPILKADIDYTSSSSSESSSSSSNSSSSESSSSSVGLDGGYFIYKELKEGTEYTYRSDKLGDDTTVEFQLLPAYYRFNAEYSAVLPDELFVRYNEIDDYLGDEFDFNYDYAELDGLSPSLGENTGVVTFRTGFSADGFIYKRKNTLAVQEAYGYDSATDILMTVTERVTEPLSAAYATIEVSAADYYFDDNRPLMIYHNGVLIYPSVGDGDFAVTITGDATKTITIAFTDTDKTASELPKDVMLIHYERLTVGFGWEVDEGITSTEKNFDAWGYRVVCYEKTRVASMFVSSYPNWVYDHLNNSPDIFEGYEEYPGMTTATVYPHYLEGGYNIYYREGAVTFDTPIEQILTAYDALNFVPAVNTLPVDTSADNPALQLYLNPVRANFAYLQGLINVTSGIMRLYSCQDGRYSYMLFDTEQYAEATGRRMVLRNDANMPSFFEVGGDSYPALNSANSLDLTAMSSVILRNTETIKINTRSNRVQSVLFRHLDVSATANIWLNTSYAGATGVVTYPSSLESSDVILNLRMNEGVLEVKELGSDDWAALEDFATVIDGGFSTHEGIITSGNHFYEYDNISWSYKVYVELLSYRSTAVEFLVYRLEK